MPMLTAVEQRDIDKIQWDESPSVMDNGGGEVPPEQLDAIAWDDKPVEPTPEDTWGEVASKGAARGVHNMGLGISGAGQMVSEAVPAIKPYVDTAAEFYNRKLQENKANVPEGSVKDYVGRDFIH